MSKILYENFKDYFRVGAAISGIILMSNAEREMLFEQMKRNYSTTEIPTGRNDAATEVLGSAGAAQAVQTDGE